MKKIKVLLADDHAVLRGGLKVALETDPRIVIVGEAKNGTEAVELTQRLQPDVIVMDVDMPGENGIEATKEIRKSNQSVKILMLTMHENEEFLYDALNAGINGYVLKMTAMESFLDAVRSVAAGNEVYGEQVARIVHSNRAHGRSGDVKKSPFRPSLTRREREILQMLSQGSTSQHIADELSISPYTVNNHRKNIMQKLQCHNAAAMIRKAIDLGLIPPL